MSVFATLLLAAVLIGNTAGQLLFKAASLRATAAGKIEEGSPTYWRLLMSQPAMWLGLILYVAEFFIWFAFLSVVPLWQGVMVASVDILAVMVAGRIFFGEQITPARVLAISLIAIGVLLVGWGGEMPT
jgi:drug/metabolite transporter (DMT)-like permease